VTARCHGAAARSRFDSSSSATEPRERASTRGPRVSRDAAPPWWSGPGLAAGPTIAGSPVPRCGRSVPGRRASTRGPPRESAAARADPHLRGSRRRDRGCGGGGGGSDAPRAKRGGVGRR
jgi:hypothetical protein